MFGLDFGAKAGERAYLRPETAQSSYLAFDRMYEVGRKALPLGIAVIGRAYRNEIAPRQLLFRMRAFTQAELQIFFDPAAFSVPFDSVAESTLPVLRAAERLAGRETTTLVRARDLVEAGGLPEFYVYHLAQTVRFFVDVLGVPMGALRLFEKSEQERAFYNRLQFDVEVLLESLGGYKELGAVHYRGDYDLSRHGQGSGKDFSVPTAPGRPGPPPRARADLRRRPEPLGARRSRAPHGGGADRLGAAAVPRPGLGRGLPTAQEGAWSVRPIALPAAAGRRRRCGVRCGGSDRPTLRPHGRGGCSVLRDRRRGDDRARDGADRHGDAAPP